MHVASKSSMIPHQVDLPVIPKCHVDLPLISMVKLAFCDLIAVKSVCDSVF